MKEFWNRRYNTDEYIYGKEPDVYFEKLITEMKPGKVLLPGEGEGRHAVFAAKHGWDVTAFDYSVQAREKALKLAAEKGDLINYYVGELEHMALPHDHFDLIALFYLHLPSDNRRVFHGKLQQHLELGGKLLLKAFSKAQIKNASGGPKNPDMLYDPSDLQNDFDELVIHELSEQTIHLQEGPYHQGKAEVIYLLGEKK